MAAKNKVIAGDYNGKNIRSAFGKAKISTNFINSLSLDKNSVASYEVITDDHRKSMASGISRGIAGNLLLGPVGMIAGTLSAKSKSVYMVAVLFKSGKNSLLEVDEKIYKQIVKHCFGISQDLQKAQDDTIHSYETHQASVQPITQAYNQNESPLRKSIWFFIISVISLLIGIAGIGEYRPMQFIVSFLICIGLWRIGVLRFKQLGIKFKKENIKKYAIVSLSVLALLGIGIIWDYNLYSHRVEIQIMREARRAESEAIREAERAEAAAIREAEEAAAAIEAARSILNRLLDLTDEQEISISETLSSIGLRTIVDADIINDDANRITISVHSADTRWFRSQQPVRLFINRETMTIEYAFYGMGMYTVDLIYEGEVVGNVTDHIVTESQWNAMRTDAQALVRTALAFPETARFPSQWEWGAGRPDGNLGISSHVNAQNAFGVAIRFEFSVIWSSETGEILQFVMNGERLI